MRSLIICPSSITGHWRNEIQRYALSLNAVVYGGAAAGRELLEEQFEAYSVVIVSYKTAHNDRAVFAGRQWNYIVLDEGHYIKNASNKTTQSIKTFPAEHRLILSGTPI